MIDKIINVERIIQPARIAKRKSSLRFGQRKNPRTREKEKCNQRNCGARRRSFPVTSRK
jgi:hypothetical protein